MRTGVGATCWPPIAHWPSAATSAIGGRPGWASLRRPISAIPTWTSWSTRCGPRLAEPDLAARNRPVTAQSDRSMVAWPVAPSRSADAIAIRVGIQRARLALVYFARRRCARLGEELRAEAAELARGAAVRMQARGARRRDRFVAEIDEAIGRAVDDVAGALGLTPPRPAGRTAVAPAAGAAPVVTASGVAVDGGARRGLRARGGTDAQPADESTGRRVRSRRPARRRRGRPVADDLGGRHPRACCTTGR